MSRPFQLSDCAAASRLLALTLSAFLLSTCAWVIGIEDLPECGSSGDCADRGENWVCNADNACEPPATDMDCSDHGECNMAAPYCDPGTMRCRTCSDGTECQAVDEGKPICNIDGQCVAGCGSDMDCDRGSPVCNMITGVCGPCSGAGLNETCMMREEGADYCSDGACVECTDDAHCADGTLPVCGAMKQCVGCTQHSHCERFSKVCGGNGECVPEAEVIYVVQDATDTESCTKDKPCGNVPAALALVTATRRFIRLDGNAYAENIPDLQDIDVSIIGDDAELLGVRTTEPVVDLLDNVNLELDGVTVRSTVDGPTGIRCRASDTSHVTLVGATVSDNTGQGIDLNRCRLTASRSRISNNGVGVLATNSQLVSIESSLISNNTDGGISITDSPFHLVNNYIIQNGASDALFGGVQITNIAPADPQTLKFNTILDNTVQSGRPASGVTCTTDTAMVASSNIVRAGQGAASVSDDCDWIHSSIEGLPAGLQVPTKNNIDQDCTMLSEVDQLPRMHMDSMCKERGEPSTGIVFDYDGEPRPEGTDADKPDMGADEFVEKE